MDVVYAYLSRPVTPLPPYRNTNQHFSPSPVGQARGQQVGCYSLRGRYCARCRGRDGERAKFLLLLLLLLLSFAETRWRKREGGKESQEDVLRMTKSNIFGFIRFVFLVLVDEESPPLFCPTLTDRPTDRP